MDTVETYWTTGQADHLNTRPQYNSNKHQLPRLTLPCSEVQCSVVHSSPYNQSFAVLKPLKASFPSLQRQIKSIESETTRSSTTNNTAVSATQHCRPH